MTTIQLIRIQLASTFIRWAINVLPDVPDVKPAISHLGSATIDLTYAVEAC